MILDGLVQWQISARIRQAEQDGIDPWTVPDGCKPLSERQFRRYMLTAARLAEHVQARPLERNSILDEHYNRRNVLYRRLVSKGDERGALTVLDSLAKLQGLFPTADTPPPAAPQAVQVTGTVNHVHRLDSSALLQSLRDSGAPLTLDAVGSGSATPCGDVRHDGNAQPVDTQEDNAAG